jgi:hypothetical protein
VEKAVDFVSSQRVFCGKGAFLHRFSPPSTHFPFSFPSDTMIFTHAVYIFLLFHSFRRIFVFFPAKDPYYA